MSATITITHMHGDTPVTLRTKNAAAADGYCQALRNMGTTYTRRTDPAPSMQLVAYAVTPIEYSRLGFPELPPV